MSAARINAVGNPLWSSRDRYGRRLFEVCQRKSVRKAQGHEAEETVNEPEDFSRSFNGLHWANCADRTIPLTGRIV